MLKEISHWENGLIEEQYMFLHGILYYILFPLTVYVLYYVSKN